jgi:hypothetical protein
MSLSSTGRKVTEEEEGDQVSQVPKSHWYRTSKSHLLRAMAVTELTVPTLLDFPATFGISDLEVYRLWGALESGFSGCVYVAYGGAAQSYKRCFSVKCLGVYFKSFFSI